MTTLSLAMIVKNEGDTIERILSCARSFCDELVVVDTGSTDDTVFKAQAMGATVHHFKWIDDFAAARNFAFSQATMDWIIWLDGDDIVTPENQQRILDIKNNVLNDALDGIYLRYIYPPFVHWRERIIRRAAFGSTITWQEPIHECLIGIGPGKAKYFDDVFIQHDTPPDRHGSKKDRNLTILRRHLQSGADDERTLYMYAVECLHSMVPRTETEPALEKFLATSKTPAYRYEVSCKAYTYYMQMGDRKLALEALQRALVEDPARGEFYYKMGRHVADVMIQPQAAIALLTTASMIPMPNYGTPEIEAYGFGPWEALARVYFRLEQVEKAKEMARIALARSTQPRPWLEQLIDYDPLGFFPENAPYEWQQWALGNLMHGSPRHFILHGLDIHGYNPSQMMTTLRYAEDEMKRLQALA